MDGWKDIVAIEADSAYAVGLTKDGQVRMAGYCKPFLDMGRSDAANWKNIMAIACSNSGIAAIGTDRTLRLAGNLVGDCDELMSSWNAQVKKKQL